MPKPFRGQFRGKPYQRSNWTAAVPAQEKKFDRFCSSCSATIPNQAWHKTEKCPDCNAYVNLRASSGFVLLHTIGISRCRACDSFILETQNYCESCREPTAIGLKMEFEKKAKIEAAKQQKAKILREMRIKAEEQIALAGLNDVENKIMNDIGIGKSSQELTKSSLYTGERSKSSSQSTSESCVKPGQNSKFRSSCKTKPKSASAAPNQIMKNCEEMGKLFLSKNNDNDGSKMELGENDDPK